MKSIYQIRNTNIIVVSRKGNNINQGVNTVAGYTDEDRCNMSKYNVSGFQDSCNLIKLCRH